MSNSAITDCRLLYSICALDRESPAAAFVIEGLNRLAFLCLDEPNEGTPIVYTVRLFSYLLILAAIIHKNRH